MKRVLILDLDNTIYPVLSIADEVFGDLFKLIDEQVDTQSAQKAKQELTRRPYQQVADEFGFPEELKEQGIQLLRNVKVENAMSPYKEYEQLRQVPIDKFLVTTGFTKLQFSKVEMLGVADDFKKVYVVDPDQSNLTKKDIFRKIMEQHGYATNEVLVIGDDPKSEIKAAIELGIDTFLFDPEGKYTNEGVTHHAKDYRDIAEIVSK
ncbi:HAD family hydrolase [Mucilaginibacter phyllosphaerae]